MAFDDRLGDGKAEARMAAEILAFRPHRMEAVKDRLARIGGNAGAFVLDADPDLVADSRSGDLDQPAGRREADGIVEMSLIARASRSGLPITTARVLARPGEGDPRVAVSRRRFPACDELLDQRAEVDRLERGAGELGVDPRGFGDVDDQPVEPARRPRGRRRSVCCAKLRILDPVEPVDRGAQRGEGVLELVGDVGGEGFGSVDPLAQRLAHVANARASRPISSRR